MGRGRDGRGSTVRLAGDERAVVRRLPMWQGALGGKGAPPAPRRAGRRAPASAIGRPAARTLLLPLYYGRLMTPVFESSTFPLTNAGRSPLGRARPPPLVNPQESEL